MNIEYITCSGIGPHNDISEIINLGKNYENAEFAVQVSREKFFPYNDRYNFFRTLVATCTVNDVNLAMHVNLEYRTDLCRGIVPEFFQDLWSIKRQKGTQNADKPVIGRVQININGGNDKFTFYADKVADIIRAYPGIKFIFQYAPEQYERISKLDKRHVSFALLYDASGGRGISPEMWDAPVFQNHQMGYSGGMSPDNVVNNLNDINEILPMDYSTWIDAEGKLKSPDDNGKKLFDTTLAEKYIKNACAWQMKNGYNR